MADKVIIEFDDSGAINQLNQSIEQMRQLATESKKSGESLKKELGGGIKESNKVVREGEENFKKLDKAIEDTTEAAKKQNSQLLDNIKNYKVFGVSINDVQNRLKSAVAEMRALAVSLRAGAASTTGLAGALKVLRTALISTGIGALVVALGSVVAFLTRTQRGVDLVSKAMTGLGVIVGNIIDRFSRIGEIIVSVFQGKTGIIEGVKEATGAFRGLTAEITEEAKRAVELKGRLQELRDEFLDLSVEQAEAQKRIAALRLDAEDETKPIKERIDALRDAAAIEQSLLEKTLAKKREQLAIEQELVDQNESLFEEIQAVAQLRIEISQLETRSLQTQRRLTTRTAALQREQQAEYQKTREEVEKARQAVIDLLTAMEELAQGAELELADPVAKARAEYEAALKTLELMYQQFDLLNTTSEQQVKFARDYAFAVEDIGKKYIAALREIDGSILKAPEGLTPFGTQKALEEFEQAALRTSRNIGREMKESLEEQGLSPLQRLSKRFAEALGLSSDEMQVVSDAVSNTFTSVISAYQTNVQAQLDANQQLIDSIRARRDTIEEELEAEQRAAELGYANNVELKKKELSVIAQEEQKAIKEREKLQKKQLRAQLLAESALQASNLATAATNIFKVNSGIPIVGIIQAIASIAAMFAAYSSAKAQAAKASEPQRLYKGGSVRDFGLVAERGPRSDVPGRNRGHMVEDSNLMLGGNEFVHKEQVSKEHYKFFKHLNENDHLYRGLDLLDYFTKRPNHDIGRPARDYARDVPAMASAQNRIKKDSMKMAFKEIFAEEIQRQTKELITYDERKEQVHYDNGKEITIKRDRNGVKKIVRKLP